MFKYLKDIFQSSFNPRKISNSFFIIFFIVSLLSFSFFSATNIYNESFDKKYEYFPTENLYLEMNSGVVENKINSKEKIDEEVRGFKERSTERFKPLLPKDLSNIIKSYYPYQTALKSSKFYNFDIYQAELIDLSFKGPYELLYGTDKLVNKNDIIVSSELAIHYLKNEYQAVGTKFNYEFSNGTYEFKVVGVYEAMSKDRITTYYNEAFSLFELPKDEQIMVGKEANFYLEFPIRSTPIDKLNSMVNYLKDTTELKESKVYCQALEAYEERANVNSILKLLELFAFNLSLLSFIAFAIYSGLKLIRTKRTMSIRRLLGASLGGLFIFQVLSSWFLSLLALTLSFVLVLGIAVIIISVLGLSFAALQTLGMVFLILSSLFFIVALISGFFALSTKTLVRSND